MRQPVDPANLAVVATRWSEILAPVAGYLDGFGAAVA